MEVEDVLGFGKASEKLLDLLGKTCGTLYRPTSIRRDAAAKAEEIHLLGKAAAEAEADKIRIIGLANAEDKLLTAQVDTEILERAKARLVTREIQRQNNIESIAGIALTELPSVVSEEPVEDNWRVRFFNIAEDITDTQMQTLWGKLLAGEVASPGRYSIRTLEVLRNLSRCEAELFQCLRSLVFDGGWIAQMEDSKIPRSVIPFPNPPDCNYAEYGVTYDHILNLRSAGLVAYGDSMNSTFYRAVGTAKGERWITVALNNGIPVAFETSGESLNIPVIVLTQAGKELMSLITPSPNVAYLRRVADGLRPRNIEMYRAKTIDGVVHGSERDEF